MTGNNEKIHQLLEKVEDLLKRQDYFAREIDSLRIEINRLKFTGQEPLTEHKPASRPDSDFRKEPANFNQNQHQPQEEPLKQTVPPTIKPPKGKSDLEKFIGENLTNKIGIAITVIGVAIGARYSIENDLLSPLTRIILGYLFGLGLLGMGMKLKSKYENYSAVLVSGAMAIMYFITYSAYGLYELFPQMMAFVLMVIFTVFTVVVAINYNRQIIAHIGLVGAYAIPFLLSEGSDKVDILFSYMAILNIGILAIAFKKYWKPIYYSSFALTWFMYFLWYATKYQTNEYFGLAFVFLSLFFAIFYLTFLAYKLLHKDKFDIGDIILLMANSFIFYGLGYALLHNHNAGGHLLGLFTLCNAIVHAIVSVVIYRQKLADKNLFYFVTGLVLVFITIAIPVQLGGSWVTLLWAGQAALLFWIGRTKNVSFYEMLSYPVMVLAFFSLAHDWLTIYAVYNPEMPETRLTPLLNINFLCSLLFIAAFGFINFTHQHKKYLVQPESQKKFSNLFSLVIPAILLLSLYYAFRMEISNYWNQLYLESALTDHAENEEYPGKFWNYDLNRFETIWILNYSLLFVSTLTLLTISKIKNAQLGIITFFLTIFAMVAFLTQGLYTLSELRESYLEQTLAQYYERGVFNLIIRYVSLVFVSIALLASYKYIRQEFVQREFKLAFDFLLHTSVLWIASSELINWMVIAESTQSYKLGLSILWGVYSLFLIVLGIWKQKKHLRMGAIAWFGVTLVKLFLYDISDLNTIAKTIVFVSLGVLLLIISFLYNKYKHTISEEVDILK